MYLSELVYEHMDITTITNVIFDSLADDGLNGDLIFVFGSTTAPKYRVPKAVELYNAGRAPKMLMSGGQSDYPEALLMKEAAIELGVDETDILVESKSKNTKENVLFSIERIDRLLGIEKVKRIIVVTNYFHLLRCYLSMRTYMPDWMEFSLCGMYDTHTKPDNWWLNERGNARVRNEMQKLIHYAKTKEICDMELDLN